MPLAKSVLRRQYRMSESVIELENVTKVYSPDVHALNGITLSIPLKGMYAFVGPSGSGKSTLLHIIGAMDVPTSGNVVLDGVKLNNLKDYKLTLIRRKKVGFVFQDYNLLPNLTALENIMVPMEFAGMSRIKRLRNAALLLEMAGLAKRSTHKPSQLSGGEKQRVAIARALANNPKVILADEPTGNLDSKNAEQIYNLFRNLAKDHTVIVVTHVERLAQLADRVFYLKDGKLTRTEKDNKL